MSTLLKVVFGNWYYATLSAVIAFAVFAFAVWLPNLQLLYSILVDPLVPISDKIVLPINMLGGIQTNFTVLSATTTILVAILVGLNASLMIRVAKRARELSVGAVSGSGLGLLSGILGVGCASCGTFLVMTVFGMGAASTISFLPLKGGEFGIAGVLLLGITSYLLIKKITQPLVCDPA